MINLRQQTVNVNRRELIEALKKGLELHRKRFNEADADYKAAVIQFQSDALSRANAGDFKDMRMTLTPPTNKAQEYMDIIDLMGVSVDDTVQIDMEAFKAFYKNQWSWTGAFEASAALYKTALGGMQ